MMISPVSELTTSSGIFSPSKMLLKASVNCSRNSSVLDRWSSSICLACFLAEVGDVARDFLRPQLGVARADFKLLDVNRGKDVILDDSLADQDRVFEVVTVPGHKGDQHVAAERQLAAARAGAVGNDLAFL